MRPTKLPRKQLLPTAAILTLSLILASLNLLIHPAIAQTNYSVTILDLSFSPQVCCIEKGDTVVWTNNDPLIYKLWFVFAENQSTYLFSDPIAPGESWSHTFNQPCKLFYYDFGRLWITGKLRVWTLFGDADGDGDVDASDLFDLSKAYGSKPGDPGWNPDCDLDWDENVDGSDLFYLSRNYGKIDP